MTKPNPQAVVDALNRDNQVGAHVESWPGVSDGAVVPAPLHMARQLTPSEYLAYCLLAAASKRGEASYTMPATVGASPLQKLARRGLALILDQQLGSITAQLTEAGLASLTKDA